MAITAANAAVLPSGATVQNGDVSISVNQNHMQVSAGSLEVEDLVDYTEKDSLKIGGGYSGGTATATSGGSMAASRDRQHATLGKGKINIKGSVKIDGVKGKLSDINRDVAKQTTSIYDIKQDKANVDMTLDTNLLTENGRKKIAKDMDRSGDLIVDVADGVKNAVTSATGITNMMDSAATRRVKYKLQDTAKGRELLANLEKNKGTAKGAMYRQKLTEMYAKERGLDIKVKAVNSKSSETGKSLQDNIIVDKNGKIIATKQQNGAYVEDKDGNGTVILDASGDMNGKSNLKEEVETVGHEMGHAGAKGMDKDQSEALSHSLQDKFYTRMNEASGGKLTATDFLVNQNSLNNSAFIRNNNIASANINITKQENDKVILVHGTYSSPEERFSDPKLLDSIKKRYNVEDKDIVVIDWSAKTLGLRSNNDPIAREKAAKLLADKVPKVREYKNEPVYEICHSHGGNVCKLSTKYLSENRDKIDGMELFSTPQRPDYKINYNGITKNGFINNFYDSSDMVQSNGGNSFINIKKGDFWYNKIGGLETGKASRKINNPRVNNIKVEAPNDFSLIKNTVRNAHKSLKINNVLIEIILKSTEGVIRAKEEFKEDHSNTLHSKVLKEKPLRKNK